MLTSRERMRLVLEHKIPDRIPIDMGGSFCTGISTIAYNRLRNRLGFGQGLAKMYDINQQLAYPESAIMELLNLDVIDAGQAFLTNMTEWKEWILNDGSRCLVPTYLNLEIDSEDTVLLKNPEGMVLGKKPKSSLYIDQTYWVYKDLPVIPDSFDDQDLGNHIWAIPIPPFHLNFFNVFEYEQFINKIRNLYNKTNYSIFLSVGCSIIEIGYFLRGFDNFLCDVLLDLKGVRRLLDKLMGDYMKLLERVINGVGEFVDVIFFGDDFAGEDRMFFSPDTLKKVFIPYYKKMWNYVHDHSSCKVFFHSCGAIFEAIPALIDAGMDILSPVQTSAKGMDPEKLKKEFGSDIVYWGGGVDTQHVLPFKKTEEIKDDVKRRIDIFGKGGGFVFNAIHNILADVPAENILAMLEAAHIYGGY
jgi:uroporphyrinogen decarboxylase